MWSKSGILPIFSLACIAGISAKAFDNSRYDNIAVYWGQNSYGTTHTDKANFQKMLSFYCKDDAIDIFPVAFLDIFFGPGGVPLLNLASIRLLIVFNSSTFPGTNMPRCDELAGDIKACQAKGKIVTLSLGGATGAVGFSSNDQAIGFAKQIWDMFLGGQSDIRPFGDAVLDGIDLDIEGGTSAHYATFVNTIRSYAKGANKKYYVTAAPQCVFPDAALGEVLNSAEFNAIYVQFYNNPCGLTHFSDATNWNFGLWDGWARSASTNKDVKVYIGVPAATSAAGSGYVNPDTLKLIAVQMRKSFPSFGDASQAYANDRYDLAIKNALVAAGGTGFTYPVCTAPLWAAGTAYSAGSKVSYGGYLWQAKWYASSQPANILNGEWSALSACSGEDKPNDTTTNPTTTPTTASTTTRTTPTTTTSQPAPTSSKLFTTRTSGIRNGGLNETSLEMVNGVLGRIMTAMTMPKAPTPTNGVCSGVADWLEGAIYQPGMKVVYRKHLWSAKWRIQGDQWGPWKDEGACSSVVGDSDEHEGVFRIQPDKFMNLAKQGLDAYNESQSNVSKTGGAEYNTGHHQQGYSSGPTFNDDEVIRNASHHGGGSGDSSLFKSALSFLSDRKDDHQRPIDEESVTRAHQQAYQENRTSGMDASSLGSAAAMQVLKQFIGGSGSGSSNSHGSSGGGSQTQLISMAMAEAAKLFDKSGGSAQGNKQDAVNGAAMTIMKLLVQSKFSGGAQTTGGPDSGGLSGLLSLASKFAK
uniref:chitinase n=1 Tax=Moniliophthora roreri TaxID=221103 RepID=A0A0W0FAU0_MONRR